MRRVSGHSLPFAMRISALFSPKTAAWPLLASNDTDRIGYFTSTTSKRTFAIAGAPATLKATSALPCDGRAWPLAVFKVTAPTTGYISVPSKVTPMIQRSSTLGHVKALTLGGPTDPTPWL